MASTASYFKPSWIDQAQDRWFPQVLFLLIAMAVLVRLFYWGYTGRTWDDALITVLHSENAARGLGLTHLNPGERPLHGFTSPLSVLVPLIGDLVHVRSGIALLKFISALLGGVAVWLGVRISVELELPPVLALASGAFLALDHHQILWGMAGMETQVVIVAYLYSIYCMQAGTQWQKGLSLGLVMLARPDGAIWVAIACGGELWKARRDGTWRDLQGLFGGLALLYLPWLIFTFLYYGSPVPNTIRAKSLGYPSEWAQLSGLPMWGKVSQICYRLFNVLGSLGPGYGGNGTGFERFWDHRIIGLVMIMFGALGGVVAFRRRQYSASWIYAFVLAYTLYLTFLANFIFGWYTAPVASVAVIGSMYGFWHVLRRFGTESSCRAWALWGTVAYLACILSVLPAAMRSDRYIQKYIEDGQRKQLGLYLAHHSLPGDTVASESLGYIGYYSQRTIYDYPGLCNRTVVQYLRDHPGGRNMISMMNALRPNYLVLRPIEYRGPDGRSLYPWIERDYELVRVYKVPNAIREKILDAAYNVDFEFDLFHMKGQATQPVL